MALLTPLQKETAEAIAIAHGLGSVREVQAIPAGSVNTNYVLGTDRGRVFLRIYEEQDADGVAREWALLERLAEAGVPAPRRVPGPGPGVLRVAGKPVGVFVLMPGEELCHQRVTTEHAARVGAALARCHRVLGGEAASGGANEGRFTFSFLRERLAKVEREGPGELTSDVQFLRARIDELEAAAPALPSGIIHGDLFRDNVRWDGPTLVGILDWESASLGRFLYDLMVTVVAWTYYDAFEFERARAMVAGYVAERPLERSEADASQWCARAACVRFAVTRLTDYELRKGRVVMQYRDYRRFLARLREVEALGATGWATALGLR